MKHNPHNISPAKDIATLAFFLIVAVFLSIFFSVSWLVSIVLFFLPPAIWFSTKMSERVLHILLFSFMFVGFFVFPIDYIATINQAWSVNSIFPFKILGVVPVEDMIWAVVLNYLSIMSYEYFFERAGHEDVVGKKRKKQTIIMISVFVVFLLLVAIGTSFTLPYAYAVLGFITSLVPLGIFLRYYPRYAKPFLIMGLYFSTLAIAHEYIGLPLHHWTFLGEYISWVNVGFALIPLEEVIFYFVLMGPTALAYYKFADDRDA